MPEERIEHRKVLERIQIDTAKRINNGNYAPSELRDLTQALLNVAIAREHSQ